MFFFREVVVSVSVFLRLLPFARGLFYLVPLLILFVGCEKAQRKNTVFSPGTEAGYRALRINIGEEPNTLDPARARTLQAMTLTRMLFEGLTRINKKNEVEMALAERVEISEDLLTYTFYLRDAKWTNEEMVSAYDFVYAWKRVVAPDAPFDNAYHLYPIKNAQAIKEGILPIKEFEAKAIDAKTLQVRLEKPTPYFLELTAYAVYSPVHEETDRKNPTWMQRVDSFVGNGPFSLEKWKHEDFILVRKNEKYWDSNVVQLQEIAMYMIQGEAELGMFQNNDIDWVGSPLSKLPLDALDKLKEQNLLEKQPILGTYFLRLNTAHPFLRSSSIRKALSLSLNREELVQKALMDSQVAASGYVPDFFQLREGSYFHGDDRLEAMKLFDAGLAELSMLRAEIPNLELIFGNSERNQRIVQLLQERWQKVLGLKVSLHAMELKVFFDNVARGNYALSVGDWVADFNDPLAFLEIFKSKTVSTNRTNWENEEYKNLIEASTNTTDVSVRKQMLAKCEKILIDSMPVIPLFHYNLLYIKDNHLADVFISNLGIVDFRWAHFSSSFNLEEGVVK